MAEALVIDDNRTTADARKQMLAVLGLKSRVAYGSSPAMTLLGSGFIPSFVFLDINMPGVDGTEILAFLRREPELIPVPVFIVTSDDQPETGRHPGRRLRSASGLRRRHQTRRRQCTTGHRCEGAACRP